MTEMTGRFETAYASRYLQQLCKHFAHKVEARWDERAGSIAFPFARATLGASPEALTVVLESGDLSRGREVIDSHLKRFAFREGFERMDWTAAFPASGQVGKAPPDMPAS